MSFNPLKRKKMKKEIEKKALIVKEVEGKYIIEEWKEKLPPIMKCGHQAQAIWKAPKELEEKDIWTCVICDGKESRVIEEKIKDFEGKFECDYHCGSFAEWNKEKRAWIVNLSSQGGWNATYGGNREVNNLPFLDIKKKKFYCGCGGWD